MIPMACAPGGGPPTANLELVRLPPAVAGDAVHRSDIFKIGYDFSAVRFRKRAARAKDAARFEIRAFV